LTLKALTESWIECGLITHNPLFRALSQRTSVNAVVCYPYGPSLFDGSRLLSGGQTFPFVRKRG